MRLFKRVNIDAIKKLTFVAVAIAFVLVKFFEMSWGDAALYSPLVLAVYAASLFVLTQVLSVVLSVLDEVGPSIGLRRSPLV